MKHDYLGRSTGKFPGATEKVILFSGRNVPNGNSCSISLKPSLIPVLGLRGRFLVNRTDIYVQNGKCDSETKFTISEFCVPFTRTVNRLVYPCKC